MVYKARDLDLERYVALKFVTSRRLDSSQDIAVLVQEARAISALNHPNIATIYELEEAGGQRFLVLEYLPRGTLKAKLNAVYRSGQKLPTEQIVRCAIQMAEGLAHAHRHGIIHRDFKAENVMLTEEGRWKITDFGLAKLRGRSAITEAGVIMGTPANMSPEQVQGLESDHRSDIFSFGIVAYHLATGELPFRASQFTALLREIVQAPAPPMKQFRDDIPEEFERIVHRCLEKKPTDRYQGMDEVLAELRSLVMTLDWTEDETKPTIAVLAFTDMSPQKDQEYLCDGMAEEIINALTKLRCIRVASRTSAFHFKGRSEDIRKIGAQLKVRTILEGSVRKAGDRLRVTTVLTSVSEGYQIWSERYDRPAKDVFDIQDEIAQAVVDKLKVKLVEEPGRKAGSRYTEYLEAYHLYLKGRYYWNKRTGEGLRKAIEYFNQALEQDPNYAPAYAGLADVFVVLVAFWGFSAQEGMPKAKAAAVKALEIDETLAEAHASLGAVKALYDWDWPGSQREFLRAIELNPGYATAHYWYASLCLQPMGRSEESVAEMCRALECDPLSLIINASYGMILNSVRQYDRAIEQCRKTLELEPAFYYAHWVLGAVYLEKGMPQEAIEATERAKALAASSTYALHIIGQLGRAYAEAGRREEACKLLKELEELSAHGYASAYHQATICIGLRELDRAVGLLERAAEERYAWLIWLRFPIYDELWSNPRFIALIKKIGLEESGATTEVTPWSQSQRSGAGLAEIENERR